MKNKSIYIRLIVTYVVVFSIPLLLNLFSLEGIAETTRTNICQSVLSNLDHAGTVFSGALDEMDTIVAHLSANNTVREVAIHMDEDSKKIKISKITGVKNYMKATKIQSLMENFYLYLNKSHMIISPDQIFLDDSGSISFFQYDGMDWEEWEEVLNQNYARYIFPEKTTKQNSITEPMLVYVQSMITSSGNKGTYLFPIKSSSVKELLKDSYVPDWGWAYLVNAQGEVLLSMKSANDEFELVPEEALDSGEEIQETRLNGRPVEVMRSGIKGRDLAFVAVIPKAYMASEVSMAQRTMIFLMIAAVMTGLIGIFIVVWHRGRKIDNVLQLIFANSEESGNMPVKDEMAFISTSMKSLIDKNQNLREELLRQYPVTRELFLERILHGRGGEKSEKELEKYDIHLTGRKILVVIFWIVEEAGPEGNVNTEETVVYKKLLQQNLSKVLPGEKYSCETDLGTGLFLCALEQDSVYSREEKRAVMNELCHDFRMNVGITVRIAVGQLCDSLDEVGKSYDRVCELLQYGASTGESVMFCDDYMDGGEYYFFPVSLEERLVNAVRTGNQERMHDQLRELYQINVMERSVNPTMLHFLVNDLQCAVFKVLHSLERSVDIEDEKIYRELEQVNQENDILLRFNRINRIFSYICEKVQESNNAGMERKKEEIEGYIREHCGENDMSLIKISEDFGYASSYFSRLFKDIFQENFASYLEKIRIENVCELLKGSDTLEVIAQKAGYNSAYVMRGAFKRLKGMTPNDFRKMN